VIFALAAALSWGLADFLGAVSTRRVGLLLPLVVIAGGLLVFSERLRKVQFLGIGLTIAGLFVLGLGR
jgi:EamA domain-containing membrane protein RarD